MSIATFEPLQAVTVTDTAHKHILKEIAKSEEASAFRLFLQTSGCSGFMYETELANAPSEGDLVIPFDGFDVFVASKDLAVLNGTEIDFVTVGLNSMFQFRNPNVTGECGCGESFSVTEEA
jgi:iron-sulfur cluster assembly accessory protein